MGVKKQKILLLSDDIRSISGVALISKQLVLNTINIFDWVQIAAQPSSENEGSIIDVSESVKSLTNAEDAYVRLYCSSGYGNPDLLRNTILSEAPDIILHFSDLRNWQWLYKMEHELRQTIPICYYHVWDNEPVPYFNDAAYYSCDWIACISKLTEKCVRLSAPELPPSQITYIPHGVDTDVYKPLDPATTQVHSEGFLDGEYDFVILCNNVNMPRKQLPLLFEAYKLFCDKLSIEKRNKVSLLLHTNPLHTSGANLYEISDFIGSEYNVLFSTEKINDEWLNCIYNIADVTINVACAEGFGLSTLESLSAATPIIATNTGGLAEQLGGDECKWGLPIQPQIRNLVGSQHVPYIYNDICNPQDIADALEKMYKLTGTERDDLGKAGREFVLQNGYTLTNMCDGITEGILSTLENFSPRKRFTCTQLTN